MLQRGVRAFGASSASRHSSSAKADIGTCQWLAAAAVGVAATSAASGLVFCDSRPQRMSDNRTLGGTSAKHRVGITAWALRNPREQGSLDKTAKSFQNPADLFKWLSESGYDVVELTVDDLRERFWPDLPPKEIVERVKPLCRQFKVSICGSLYHISDGGPICGPQLLDYEQPDFFQAVRRKLELEKEMGSEYVTFQLCLPQRHMNTGGAYRNDDAYLQLSAIRIAKLQEIAFDLGLNFYVETHIDRISEDPEAFCKIMDMAPYFEVNADISHYVYRGISRGQHLERICARVGHSHQRMARTHGDLSADLGITISEHGTGDGADDWQRQGVTWLAMQAMKPCFEGGLSSRVIIGESGPAFGVKDALDLDARLVPLWRYMARYADARAKGQAPDERNPFK